MLYEFDAHKPSVEGMYWTVLSGVGNGGNFILFHQPWSASFSAPMWEVVDYWLASERRAWLVFRDREYPTYDFAPGYGLSGSIGDFEKYLRLVNPEQAPQACSPALAKSARSANATVVAKPVNVNVTPACADALLPTPAIPPAATPSPGADVYSRLFNRQARRLDPGVSWQITVSGDWPAFGYEAPAQVTVSYLDAGRDTFEVNVAGPGGAPVRHTIQKQGTGVWQRAQWLVDLAVGNLLADDSFIRITNDAVGAEYLHEIYVTVPKGLPFTPTPSSTPSRTATRPATATPTPTFTPQPSPTATATLTSEPSATPTNTPTRTPALSPTSQATATTTPSPAPPTSTATRLPPPSPTPTSVCEPRSHGITLLDGPRGLTAVGPDFYVALFESSEVARLDAASHARAWQAASGPGRTNGVAAWGNTLVTSNRDAGTITLHDRVDRFATRDHRHRFAPVGHRGCRWPSLRCELR